MTETTNGTRTEQETTSEPTEEQREKVHTTDTSAYRPIVGEQHFGRFHIFRRKAPVRPWVARVFMLANGRVVVYGRDKQPTVGELLWGGYRALYEVDLTMRRLELEITLPSAGDAFVFRAEVDVQWHVTDPKLVVESGITDIRTIVVPLLLDGLRQATRSTQAFDVEVAEKTANAQFGHDWLSRTHGLWTNVLVRLRMDKEKEHEVRLASEVQAYKTIIAGGDLDQFALQLAKNPTEVESVVQVLAKERDTYRKDVCEFLTQLLESDALDRWQIDDQVRVLLQWLGVSVNRVLTGTDDSRPYPFADAARRAGTNERNGGV